MNLLGSFGDRSLKRTGLVTPFGRIMSFGVLLWANDADETNVVTPINSFLRLSSCAPCRMALALNASCFSISPFSTTAYSIGANRRKLCHSRKLVATARNDPTRAGAHLMMRLLKFATRHDAASFSVRARPLSRNRSTSRPGRFPVAMKCMATRSAQRTEKRMRGIVPSNGPIGHADPLPPRLKF